MSSIKAEKFIAAPPAEVYRYFTNSTAFRDWLCDVATLHAHIGGHIYLCWLGEYYTSGEYVRLENNKSVAFTWQGRNEPRATMVEVSLKKKKKGTLVKVTHRGIGKGKKWETIGKSYEKQWNYVLDNLASVLETGADLRITRRPMLGVYVGEFNAEIAAKLCVPVNEGVRLEGVVEGMGAQAAGLQKDDVIVSMDGKELAAGVPLGVMINGKHAGDVVEVGFYRGENKKSTKMTLSGRNIPQVPASGVELAKRLEPVYHKYEAEFEALLNGATDDECSHKPAPGEWSANEIMAHLIHSEIGWQNFASEIIHGHEGAYDDYGGNLQARIDGTTAIFSTKNALLRELKAHDAESLALLAHLPEDFTAHKGRFWKLTYNATDNSVHLQSHLDQMRAAIAAARK